MFFVKEKNTTKIYVKMLSMYHKKFTIGVFIDPKILNSERKYNFNKN